MDFRRLRRGRLVQFLKRNLMLCLICVGVLFGIVLGLLLKKFNPSLAVRDCIGFPGEIFFRALQLLILPAIVFSLTAGAASLNIKENGKIALRTFSYFLLTSAFNTILGVLLVVAIRPGDSDHMREQLLSMLPFATRTPVSSRANTLLDNMMDLARNMIPDNMFTSLFQISGTVYDVVQLNETEFINVKSVSKRPGTNLLGVIMISLVIGSVLSTLKEEASIIIQMVKICDKVITKLIRVVIWLMPVGVTSIICAKILEVPNVGHLVALLGLFIMTVTLGIFIYQLFFLQLFYFLFIRENPFKFYVDMLPAALAGFAAQSSSVALPVTFQCLDEKAKIDTRISRFVVPLGITINMDGTALFVTVASIFIAQLNAYQLTFVDYLTVCMTATAVSIATSTTPSASLTLMFIILNAIGVPTSDIGLLFSVDWFLDRLRTLNNVLGDCYAAAIVQQLSKSELEDMDKANREEEQGIEMKAYEIKD